MSLSYTTGNPNNLTGGTTAAMNDIQGPFTDIKTFLTDGSGAVGDTILASPNNAVWKPQLNEHGYMNGNLTTGVFFFNQGGQAVLSGTGANGVAAVWAPPAAADVAVAGKTTRLRIRIAYLVNSTSAAVTATWGLYPITGSSGGVSTISPTLGTVVAGSTAAAALAGANGVATGSSFDFSAVTSGGAYCIGVTGSGSMAASAEVSCQLVLEMRHT